MNNLLFRITFSIIFFQFSLTSISQVVDWIAPEAGIGVSVDVDPFNNSYACGQIVGTTQIGTYTFVSAGAQDVIVEKHSSTGALLWAIQMGGTSGEFASKVVYDGNGNVWVSGQFSGTMNVGGNTITSLGGIDVFLVKIDAASGAILFAERAGGTGSDGATDLKVDALGNVYLFGTFTSNMSYSSTTISGGGSRDVFVLKIDNNGAAILGFAITGSNIETTWSSALDVSGNIYFAGYTTSSTVSYNGTNVNYSQNSHFFVKFDASGNFVWSNESVFNGEVYGLCVDNAGSVYFTGNFDSSPSFGSINISSSGGDDILIGKIDNLGNFIWVKGYGGTGSDQGFDLKCKPNGDLFLTGSYVGIFNFGTIPMNGVQFSKVYLAKIDSSGLEEWVQVSTGTNTYSGKGVVLNNSDDIFITGSGGGFFKMAGDTSTILGSFLVKLADNANEISGYVFNDANNNGVFDGGETGTPNAMVQLDGGPYVSNSNSIGKYEVYAISGNHTVSIPNIPLYHTLTTPASQSANFVGMGNTDSLNHFGLYPTPNMNDLRVDITPVTSVKAGYVLAYMVTYKNVGTTTLSPVITLTNDAGIVYINSSPTEDSQSAQTTTWNIGSLAPGEIGTIHANFNIPSGAAIGTPIISSVEISPLTGDNVVADNTASNTSLVTGPYDPNYKTVDQDTLYNITSSEYLEYIVHFQNVGNDTSYNVVIIDTMSSYLDLSTMEIIAASHQMNFSISNGNIMEFRFDNIFLPDSTTDQVGSNGFVKFKVKHVASIPFNETIANFVDIYFDFNAAVRTNTATTIHLDANLSVNENEEDYQILIYPNPTKNDVRVQFTSQSISSSITLIDLTGKVLKTIKTNSNSKVSQVISLNQYNSGIYFLRIEDGARVVTKKIIKQ